MINQPADLDDIYVVLTSILTLLEERLSGAASTPAAGCRDRAAGAKPAATDLPDQYPRCLDKLEALVERWESIAAHDKSEQASMEARGHRDVAYYREGSVAAFLSCAGAIREAFDIYAPEAKSAASEAKDVSITAAIAEILAANPDIFEPIKKLITSEAERASGRGNAEAHTPPSCGGDTTRKDQ